MSQENVEIVREGIEAWNQHDADRWLRNAAPDVEWMPAGPAAVERTVYRGHDEVASGFAAIWQTWDLFQSRKPKSVTSAIPFSGSVGSRCEEAPAKSPSTRSSPFTLGCETVRSSPFALSSRGERPSKPWGCRSKTLTPTPEPAGYCAGDVAGERGASASLDRAVE